MLHKDLRVDGKKLPNEEGLEKILQSAHFTCEIGELVLEVEFSEARSAFIGWLSGEEDIFYYDNGSGDKEPAELLINVCPERRMMCHDAEIIRDIVYYFCETGERNINGLLNKRYARKMIDRYKRMC